MGQAMTTPVESAYCALLIECEVYIITSLMKCKAGEGDGCAAFLYGNAQRVVGILITPAQTDQSSG